MRIAPRSCAPAALLSGLLVLPFLLGGCALFSSKPRPQWIEAQVTTPSEQLLREVLLLALDKSEYPVGIGMDPGKRRIESGYRMSLHAFKSKGWRETATVEWTPLGEDRYSLRARIQRETNESLRPLDLRHAKWRTAPDNPAHGEILLQYVRSQFGSDFEVGEPEPKLDFRSPE